MQVGKSEKVGQKRDIIFIVGNKQPRSLSQRNRRKRRTAEPHHQLARRLGRQDADRVCPVFHRASQAKGKEISLTNLSC
jgi:hypothetical protein